MVVMTHIVRAIFWPMYMYNGIWVNMGSLDFPISSFPVMSEPPGPSLPDAKCNQKLKRRSKGPPNMKLINEQLLIVTVVLIYGLREERKSF